MANIKLKIKDYSSTVFASLGVIVIIYFMTCTGIAANTTLVLLELIFEIICLRQISSRHALVELLSKWYHGSPNNSEIRLRLLDNSYNLYYRDETSNLDVTEEIFTFLTINNLNLVETGGLVDFSLILGNHVDSYLYGLLAVSNIWYRGGLTKLFLF